ncbi:MAG: VTT domain-containing protein [Kiritimatiellae bacterium]|nr:VTT domain-containing protein [Kiritimatiellia bacterium]
MNQTQEKPERPGKAWYLRPFAWGKSLYQWVLHWVETPYSAPALFLLAFSESSFFPIPPDVLLVAMALSLPRKGFYYAAVCSLGSVLGGIAGYGIGYFFWDAVGQPIINFYHAQAAYETVQKAYQENAFFAVFTAAFTPIPFKVFTIAGGICHIRLWQDLVLASLIGRSLRFFLVATLFFFFGPSIKRFIDRYFEVLTIIFTVLLIGGFLAIKYVL